VQSTPIKLNQIKPNQQVKNSCQKIILLVGTEGHDGTIRFSPHKNQGNCARNCTITTIFLKTAVGKTIKILSQVYDCMTTNNGVLDWMIGFINTFFYNHS
jgi:hypothetical protein